MNTYILVSFFVGYLCIALEGVTRINKTGVALLMSVVCWSLFVASAGSGAADVFSTHVTETSETILFLMGAMTIVEVLDSNGCFNFLISHLRTPSLHRLLWRTVVLTFVLSALLDNMTTSILMVMMLRRLIPDVSQRALFAGIVIIAANAGGAFSPIGDVTTIMLWIGGHVSTQGILRGLLLPSMVCVLVPALMVMPRLSGSVADPVVSQSETPSEFSRRGRILLLLIGVLGLVLVPVFRSLTGLPPFVGVMGVLGLLWISTEVMLRHRVPTTEECSVRVAETIKRIDMPTILFFLGILLSVGALRETGSLAAFGNWLEVHVGNVYAIDGAIGLLSSVVDNVPLVAGAMSMYEIQPAGCAPDLAMYQQDGVFWQLLAYCAGTGGSLLIIGSAAGVVVMGLERMTFGWYLRRFSLLALAGYLAGLFSYWLMNFIL